MTTIQTRVGELTQLKHVIMLYYFLGDKYSHDFSTTVDSQKKDTIYMEALNIKVAQILNMVVG